MEPIAPSGNDFPLGLPLGCAWPEFPLGLPPKQRSAAVNYRVPGRS